MKILISADHGGYELKNKLVAWIKENQFKIEDLGNYDFDSADDYPDFAEKVAKKISQKKADRGIVICGSGVGAAIAANKFYGVRASVCHDTYSARQGVEHDDMNVLCLGARILGEELIKEIITAFLNAEFYNRDKYLRRLKKVLKIEKNNFKEEELK